MSREVSPSTGKSYGLERVCAVWGIARSTAYSVMGKTDVGGEETEVSKRGPRPEVSDEELLRKIRRDLDRSPFVGEGHRKVWARLRVLDEIKVGKNRVLRIMRENGLLSPHRSRKAEADPHDGSITTDRPDRMWGADGARVLTVDDGWGWIFLAVDHFNSECVGVDVCKVGSRFNALEPIRQGMENCFGQVAPGAARGLELRIDHGSQYMSDHFLNQIKNWGMAPSFAFVSEPQTNGIAERFIRTLKEQVIHGRIYRNLDQVGEAVKKFVDTYNREWRLERLGFMTPAEARSSYFSKLAA